MLRVAAAIQTPASKQLQVLLRGGVNSFIVRQQPRRCFVRERCPSICTITHVVYYQQHQSAIICRNNNNNHWKGRILTTKRPSSTTTKTSSSGYATITKPFNDNINPQQPIIGTASSSSSSSAFLRNQIKNFGIAFISLSIGFTIGRLYHKPDTHHHQQQQVLPNGLPRTCCDNDDNNDSNKSKLELDNNQKELPNKLKQIVGEENIILDATKYDTSTLPYLKGSRLGLGTALCIVTPTKLHEVADIVQAVVDAKCVIIPQGQNTGLTGGSVPRDNKRPIVILSMKKLNRMFPIDDGKRIVCLAGVGLASLEQFIQKYFPDRESHSILGSTFLNPTVAAGVAFGSGGTQCRKGPAYTERALYLKISSNKWNENIIEVINTLGIEDMEEKQRAEGRSRKHMDSIAYKVDTWSRWIAEGYERTMKYSSKTSIHATKPASDVGYAERLCTESNDPKAVSRFNADTRGPEYCRSEGKVIILATVHDTFPKPKSMKTYWIGFDTLQTALDFRREVCLQNATDLPISIEYMDRDSFDVINRSGRLLGSVIKYTGTSSSVVRQLWNVKLYIEALPFDGASQIIDKFLHTINNFVPSILPSPIMNIGLHMDHNVAMTIGDFNSNTEDDDGKNNTMERLLDRLQKFATKHGPDKIKIYECKSSRDVASITAFRFVAAPAFRTWCVGEGVQGFSVDYVLPLMGGTAPPLPTAAISNASNTSNIGSSDNGNPIVPLKRMRYSHFGCNVVHEDIAYDVGVNIHNIKHDFKHLIENQCCGKLPAEHGHGTEYIAPTETQQRWKQMDPLNVLNPGVGGLSENYKYQE